jgi:hypothetical protein
MRSIPRIHFPPKLRRAKHFCHWPKTGLLGPFQLENNLARHCLDISKCWKFAELGRSVCKDFIVFMFHTATKRQVLAQNRKLPGIGFKNKDFSGHEKRD